MRVVSLGILAASAASLIFGNTDTTITLSSSANPSFFAQSVSLTATVSPSAAAGTVNFYDSGTLLGTAVVNGGRATVAVSTLSLGTHSLVAIYGGDISYQSSASSIFMQTITRATTVSLASSVNPSAYSQSVMLIATVSPNDTSGVVTFYDGVVILGIRTLTAGQARLTTDLLRSGAHRLRAFYGGDTKDGSSSSGLVMQTVGAPVSAAAAFRFAPTISNFSPYLVCDLNGDGKADIVATNSSASLDLLLGNGDGTFQSPKHLGLAGSSIFEDINADGKLDVITIDQTGISVSLGNGDGTFGPAITYAVNNSYTWATGDFNGDGHDDLIGLGANGTILFFGNGDGSFRAGPTSDYVGSLLTVGDFNGDGKADLITEGTYSILIGGVKYLVARITTLAGSGDGTFQPVGTLDIKIGGNIFAATPIGRLDVGDFDGDGVADIVASGQNFATTVLLGNGDGTFRVVQTASTSSPVTTGYAIVGDFNGDGMLDIAVSSTGVQVLYGNGDGTFHAGPNVAGTTSSAAATGDFNGDGKTDLIFVDSNGLRVLLGDNATRLKFTSEPVDSIAGTNQLVEAQTQDLDGNLVISGASVTLTSTPPGVNASVSTANGEAFWVLNIAAASTYTLTASSTGLPDVMSQAFTISPASASKLVFTMTPVSGVVGVALSPAVLVQVQDQYGNVVTGSNASVTVGSVPTGASATVSAQAGTATFNSLVFNAPGTYALTATSAGFTPIVSGAFTILGANVNISGQASVSGAGRSGVTITINGSRTSSTTTDASGRFNFSIPSGGIYTLSAALSGYSFSSPLTFSNLNANQTANFTGTPVSGLTFVPVTPCRLVDTRVSAMQSGFGPPSLIGGNTRTVEIPTNNACAITSAATAYSLNITAVTKGYLGFLTIWPTGQSMPNASTLNSYAITSTAVANAAIVPAGTNGAINVYVTDATDLIIDIDGYFVPPPAQGLIFYPVTPCRLVDTRVSSFQSTFGTPTMKAGETRTFAIPTNAACQISSTAQAYSVNVTALPQKTLGFLSIWPTGKPLPNVSTLNVYTAGTVVANAAIVPAGTNGAINAYVTDQADLVIDINGYFAPPPGNGLKFYPVTPCRIADTRVSSFPTNLGPPSMGAVTQRSFPVPQSTCGVPVGAGAYSFNFTAVPHAPQLGIFITWPTGVAEPNVSTMNSYNGSVVANAAIVPTGTNGSISIFVTDLSDVLFDVNGYFAP